MAHRLFQYEWAGLLALLVLPRFCPPGLVAWLQHGDARWLVGWPLLALHRTSLVAGLWYPQVQAMSQQQGIGLLLALLM